MPKLLSRSVFLLALLGAAVLFSGLAESAHASRFGYGRKQIGGMLRGVKSCRKCPPCPCPCDEPKPALTIEQVCPTRRPVGSNADYIITVNNTGDAPAVGVVLKHQVVEGNSFVEASDDGLLEDNYVVWNLGDLEPGDTRTVTVIHKTETIQITSCEATVTSETRLSWGKKKYTKSL